MAGTGGLRLAQGPEAVKGDLQATKEILDRVEGKVKHSISMAGESGGPIQFVVTRAGTNG
jgi:hypothetical protein